MKARIKQFAGNNVEQFICSDESDDLYTAVGIHGIHAMHYHSRERTVFDVEETETGYVLEIRGTLFEDIPGKYLEFI
ncbi:hypothetical protein phiAS5_ORF0185 [Aeromonas phage phiAS5]|uniref:Uncharacterized protein n=1 Tax=Aeromonas phage phiAS5 TaxID=879630 RepID=E1A2T2_9CAUD|nr:hypothetical protein phiAS5_ORF0185 [Aeromonas phage phiAS5]ADM80028.1 hypothetical protein phiAS5_ORF0185 [Aeromonas phage phiAS5]